MSATASAPGKVILFGEHAVVYGRPAIAVPVTQVQATAAITTSTSDFQIRALELGRTFRLADAPTDDPLAAAVNLCLNELHVPPPSARLEIHSTIPIASGMGSGAAVSVAVIRSLARYLDRDLDDDVVSQLAFQVEKIHHGTPSGIDNSVVTFGQPIYFERGRPIERIQIHTPFRILVADTGIPSSTKAAVSDVRRGWEARPGYFEELFDRIGQLTMNARVAIENGGNDRIGPLMTRNQTLLEALEVSSPELERLVKAALHAGADGAKLSGAGRGGNLIALVRPETEGEVSLALRQAGATKLVATWVGDPADGSQ